MSDYFKLFALDARFDIDTERLTEQYQQQMAQHHPDKFVNENDTVKLGAAHQSSLLNNAYQTLKDDLKRAAYLLECVGVNAFDEKDTQMNQDFLIQQIELRESLEVIENNEDEMALDLFISEISQTLKQHTNKIKKAFSEQQSPTLIKTLVRELKFYQQLKFDAQALMDKWL